MTNRSLGLGYPLIATDDLGALAERYRAMGFDPTPRCFDASGTAMQVVAFADGHIRLVGIDDPSLIDEPDPMGFRFGRFIADQLGRRDGIAMVGLQSVDLAAAMATLAAGGAAVEGPVTVRHERTLPDGTMQVSEASVATLIDWDQPALSFCVCRRQGAPMSEPTHPNGAFALERLVYAVGEPHALWQRCASIWGEAALNEQGNGFSVATDSGELLLLDRPAAEAHFAPGSMPYGWRDAPGPIGMAVRVGDLNRAHVLMMQNGVPHLRLSEAVRIPPSHAGNVVLDFVP